MKTFIKNVLEWLLGREKKCESQAAKAPQPKRTSLTQPKPRKKVVGKPRIAAKKPVAAAKKTIKKTIKK
jgi:hypothetical protein